MIELKLISGQSVYCLNNINVGAFKKNVLACFSGEFRMLRPIESEFLPFVQAVEEASTYKRSIVMENILH